MENREHIRAMVAGGNGVKALGTARCADCEDVPRWVLKLLRLARQERLTGSIDLSLKDGVPSSAKRIVEFLDPGKVIAK